MKETIKIGKHMRACGSVINVENGSWDSARCLPRWEYTTIAPGKHGKQGRPPKRNYLIFRCNDSRCKAQLAVEQDLILNDLPKF